MKQLLLVITIITTFQQAFAQADQNVALGDKYFAAGEYYTAANLYEQYLHPVKKQVSKANFPLNPRRYSQGGARSSNKSDVLYKQAESYRLANYWTEAAEKYKECYEKDKTKYKDALYWYAVCERSLGKYDVAEQTLNQFADGNMTGSIPQQDVQKEMQTLQFIKKQISKPDTILYNVKKIDAANEGKGIFAGTAMGGNQFMFTSTVTDSITIPGTNPYHSRLFNAGLDNNALQLNDQIQIDGLDASFSQGAGCMSPGKNFLYFTQWKKQNGKNVSAIYISSKTSKGWSKPVILAAVDIAGYSSKQPYCSADGKTLFFSSDMPGGSGGFDIWSAPLQTDGTAGKPVNAGSMINTASDEQAPFYQANNATLVFSSNGRQGMGGFDLFTSKMNSSGWEGPVNMGYPVNSSRDDIYFFASEQTDLLDHAIIGSDRGASCCLASYTVSKKAKKKMMSGLVRDCKNNSPLANAQVIMQDVSGKNLKTTTDADGKFSFALTEDPKQNTIVVTKEQFKVVSAAVTIESVNGSNWQTDILVNSAICLDSLEEKKLVIKAENVITVYFDFDKSLLKDAGTAVLDSVSKVLADNITATIQISGYTDGLGSTEYNQKLSDRRAKACADYLISKGVDSTRISFASFGACCPVEMEKINGRDNPDGRSKNRRAMVNISKE